MKIGGIELIGASPEQVAFLMARGDFAEKYCIEHGWPTDPLKLSIEQVLEIRKQDGWKQPKIERR